MAAGDKVWFRNNKGVWSTTEWRINIKCSQSFVAGGNVMSLLDYTDMDNVQLKPYCFVNLFGNDVSTGGIPNIVRADDLVLPADELNSYCYYQMFYGCSSLSTPPELPATKLATACYSDMFNGCSSLTEAPELPATTMADFCYNIMFFGCSSLRTPPSLPARTLAQQCYASMFNGCSSLTTAPALPATTLQRSCYYRMFMDCTSLTTAPSLPATILVDYCYQQMFYGSSILNDVTSYANDTSATGCITEWLKNVSSTGTFHKLGSAYYLRGASGIPTGWTIVNS
jgi:hypothetical protein